MLEVLVKGLPKNIEDAVIKVWYFEEGDLVTKGDDLVELVTADDVVVIISVPADGTLAEVYFDNGDLVQKDELLCTIDDEDVELKDDDEDKDEDENEKDQSDDEEPEEGF